MKKLALILAFGLFGCVTTTEQDRPEDHADAAMAFASEHTGMPAVEVPEIQYIDDLGEGAGLYDFRTGVLYLPSDWKADRHGISTLVHELTHAMQAQHRAEDFDFMTQTAFEICQALEYEAHLAAYSYEMQVAPEETRVFLMGFTVEDASEVHARNSCRKRFS